MFNSTLKDLEDKILDAADTRAITHYDFLNRERRDTLLDIAKGMCDHLEEGDFSLLCDSIMIMSESFPDFCQLLESQVEQAVLIQEQYPDEDELQELKELLQTSLDRLEVL